MSDPQNRKSSQQIWMLLGLICTALAIVGCGAKAEPVTSDAKKFRTADEADATTADNSQTTAIGGEVAAASSAGTIAADGKTAVAGGELQNVLDQLNRLARQQPKGSSQQEQIEDLVKLQNQRLVLARKALKLNPEPEMKRQLVMAMYEIHQFLAQPQWRVAGAINQLTEFAKTTAADADPDIARIGRHAMFSSNLARLPQPVEPKDIVAEAIKLLDSEKGQLSPETLELIGETADKLTENGYKKESVALIEAIAAALAADPKLAEQAPRYALVASLVKADLEALFVDVVKEEPEAKEKLTTALQTLLTQAPPSRQLLGSVQRIPYMLESTGHYDTALACYELITAAYGKAADPELAKAAAEMGPQAKRRIGLIGQPFIVDGVLADGRPFDWNAYAGKVVLVDFWATWCGPCIEEIPNIKQNFEQYHAKGFEVVGVNLNTSVADLKQFLLLQDLPWTSVTSQEVLDGKVKEDDWVSIPMAQKCGVEGIPFVLLVNKEGKVDSIHVRGPKLSKRLAELLGEPMTTEIPADPTQPPAPGPAGKATSGKQSRVVPIGNAMPVAMMVAQAMIGADPTPATAEPAANPYLAKPGQTPTQLLAYIERMLDRPQSIQKRPGFAEAIVDACDRVLKAEPTATERERLVATEAKLGILHREACDGNTGADEQLVELVAELKDDARPEIAPEVKFLVLERRALAAKDLPIEQIPALVDDVEKFAGQEKLTAKHLRLLSATVAAINRVEDGDAREKRFESLSSLLTKSSDKEVARYGKKIAKKPAADEVSASR